MAKENTTPKRKFVEDSSPVPQPTRPTKSARSEPAKLAADLPHVPQPATPTKVASANRSGAKGKRYQTQVGGTAIQGARSTQPKQITASNNAQQQEAESYNRTMRRRMQNLGTGPYAGEQKKAAKTPQERRKEKLERIKQRREEQLASIRRSLPGGKVSTDTKRVYKLIFGIAIGIAALILLFVILHLTHVIN